VHDIGADDAQIALDPRIDRPIGPESGCGAKVFSRRFGGGREMRFRQDKKGSSPICGDDRALRAQSRAASSCAQSQDPRRRLTSPQGWIPRLHAQ
jgi:hypothetical protein